MAEAVRKLTKRTVDAAAPTPPATSFGTSELKGFGLRVETSGTKTFLVRYRPKDSGAKGPKRFLTIGRHGRPLEQWRRLTAEAARREASRILGLVANGRDPAGERVCCKGRPTLRAVLDDFMSLHVEPKLKPKHGASLSIGLQTLRAAQMGQAARRRPFKG